MANLGEKFNAEDFKREPFELLPDGVYTAIIIDSQWVDTRTGRAIKCDFQVIEGPSKGRQISKWINLENENETAVRIAKQDLSEICLAVGKVQPHDTAELHNIPLELHIVTVKRKDTGEDSNKIKKITKKDGVTPLRAVPQQTNNGRPWAR